MTPKLPQKWIPETTPKSTSGCFPKLLRGASQSYLGVFPKATLGCFPKLLRGVSQSNFGMCLLFEWKYQTLDFPKSLWGVSQSHLGMFPKVTWSSWGVCVPQATLGSQFGTRHHLHHLCNKYIITTETFPCSSSSLSLLPFSCVSMLKTQRLSSPHLLVQHGASHDILQWLKTTKWFCYRR